MGNTSKRGPKTDKLEKNDCTKYLQYGMCEMQGWRSSMEDATIAAIDFDVNSSLFGVMDGHGGSTISKFVASNFVNLFTHMKSYKQNNYEQALIETFLKFDELLRLDKVNQFLKQNGSWSNKKDSQLSVTFSYGLQPEFTPSNNDINLNSLNCSDKSEHSHNHNNSNCSIPDNNSNNNKSGTQTSTCPLLYVPKENIIDLTSRKQESPRSISHHSSKSSSEDKSKDILTMNSQKIEISLRASTDRLNSDNLDDLIARDMGTTANILFIKNSYLYLANVGDSLSILFKNGVAVRLNQEHKTTLASEYTRINKSGSRIINNRIEGRLNLTRALGDLNFKRNQNLKFYEQAVTAYPEITKMKITKDFDFVIMACDGVWDCVDAQKLCEHISAKLKSKVNLSTIVSDLFDQIISKTNNTPVGTDNMSCILIQFLHD